ncbi:ornithine cyclodeaminase family protein [Nordella sp. HKS 07]|uniref:ornithine cyclodeaminase family protein n=1 Tax=Nordella sp. HKS 07 TaxID=2712222 RepID=UPI0013E12590|nr:ornithine cyclodeaminase family protein [Nordella sp. HKS 07]QIG48705.1 ornithine cyclodeaminase family protein [Nordella sp. HKS 07]
MKIISADQLAEAASYRDIVEALRQGFREDIATPTRHHHDTSPVATLLLMPAWSQAFTGIKTVVVKTDNPALGLPTVTGSYLLIDNRTGAPVAMMDGTELTRRRTACAGALAADYLARQDAETLLMVGTGALAPHFVRAHAAVRPIKTVLLYNRTPAKAEALAGDLARDGFAIEIVRDLEQATGKADIISCATTSTQPILRGQWLKPGTHIDLAGAFKPTMRETDGETIAKARVYVDTREGAEAEAGDLLQAEAEGKFRMENIQGDLFGLCRGKTGGRRNREEITLFKSCGTALEDLAAAALIYSRS